MEAFRHEKYNRNWFEPDNDVEVLLMKYFENSVSLIGNPNWKTSFISKKKKNNNKDVQGRDDKKFLTEC